MLRLLTCLVALCLLLEGLPLARSQASTQSGCCASEACCCEPAPERESCCEGEPAQAPRGPRASSTCGCGDHGPAHLGAPAQPRAANGAHAAGPRAAPALHTPDPAPRAPDAPTVEPPRRPPRRA